MFGVASSGSAQPAAPPRVQSPVEVESVSAQNFRKVVLGKQRTGRGDLLNHKEGSNFEGALGCPPELRVTDKPGHDFWSNGVVYEMWV